MMNNYLESSNGLQEVAQFAALGEIHRLVENELAKPRAQARRGGMRALIFGLCALAAAPLIVTFLAGILMTAG
jgi:hypothetical protein